MGKKKLLAAAAVVSVSLLPLTACRSEPDPQQAAEDIAAALSALDLSQVPFDSDSGTSPDTELQDITAALSPLPDPAVTAGEVSKEDPATASVELDWTWDLPDTDDDFTYTTTLRLDRDEDADDDRWRGRWHPSLVHPVLADGHVLQLQTYGADRAEILGGDGQPLVTDRPVWRVGLDKSTLGLDALGASARALAAELGLDPEAYAAQVEANGPQAFVEAIVLRQDDENAGIEERIAGIPGAVALPTTRELAPTRTFARTLIGSVGEATAEVIEESDGELLPGSQVGLSGLQRQYDDQLRGTDGLAIMDVGPDGTPSPLHQVDPVAGEPVQLTLDARLQTLAEEVLAEEPSASAIVAVRPSTGEVLAAGNGPGSEGQQTALLGQYPAGSTLKIATSLAMLRGGATADTTVQCPAEVSVDGRRFGNASTYPPAFVGDIPLRQAFAQSCNTAFINAADEVSQQQLADAAADLGIGVEAPLGTDAFFGAVPAEADGTDHAASLIGQGQVLVSPLAMAVAAASVAAGERVSPVLVRTGGSTEGTDGGEDAEAPAASKLTAEEASVLQDMMRAVVTDGGGQVLLDLPGAPAGAKTGTAEFGNETPPRTHAWFAATQGDLAAVVFVEEGELGSTSGGPLMRAFLAGAAG
ncbi:Beta-lactam-inducible penicillin-binding protein [Arthrobacter saudimassiliensis]|uniref:Beta-lactam-inducible penicillin-binding protein n=1 Tax=Arthrobacter saudimassiliensis TaxID=1461584 RepID=A0A078MUK4_9MICC|nr:Beta-lactam-inducible penicillin-binding protein [Arthrobacter saudimassiliensis]